MAANWAAMQAVGVPRAGGGGPKAEFEARELPLVRITHIGVDGLSGLRGGGLR